MALILELPVELAIAIVKELIEPRTTDVPNKTAIANVADLQELSLTCRSFGKIVKQVLFNWNKKHGRSSAVVWALENGRTDTLEDCRAFGLNLLTPGSHHHTNALNRHFDLEAPFCCQTPIGMAISYHQPAAVKWLLDEEGVSVDQLCSAVDQVAPFNAATALIPADKEEYAPRWSALEYALGHRASSVATLLIQKGATLTFTHKTQNRGVKQQHAICIAAEKGLVDVIKTLVHQRHVNVNATDADGETPLHHAVGVLGNKETILGLVDLGADLNQPAANGVTPLLKALQTGCYANAFELINAGADIKPIPGLLSPLRACLSNQPRDRFSLVGAIWLNLDDKYYLGHEPDEYADEPMPPILTALHHYQERTVRTLLQHGVPFPRSKDTPASPPTSWPPTPGVSEPCRRCRSCSTAASRDSMTPTTRKERFCRRSSLGVFRTS
ncbi:hypothetical protein PG996_012953 [Apiospora saccharicola]|uniref:Ankyrin n=1 Tax=Apiospora saccharicola TaxID=335842 RepID=A0ABR1U428_9PEZI